MPDRLSIYNGALRSVGERKLATLTERVEARRLLDDAWDNDFIDTILQEGMWDFAARAVKLEFLPSMTPSFGFQYAFAKPDDFVRTTALCEDEYFSQPMLRYTHEAGFWYADLDYIYLKYVSNDEQYGNDMSLWPANFTRYAEHFLGFLIIPGLTQSDSTEEKQEAKYRKALKRARNTDAQEKPARFAPEGSWVKSRRNRSGGDRGSRTRLIG